VYAGYGMVGLDLTPRWNVLFGVRVEATRGDYFANVLVYDDGTFTGVANPSSGTADYTDVLPGVHTTFSITKELVFRTAWTNTLGRPAYADLAPISALDAIQDTDGTWTGSLSEGNPDLKPYQSMNLDFSLEYYIPSGLLAVAPFYKWIDNPIYGRETTERNVVYDGRTYDIFSTDRPENADKGHIGGIEVNYQQTYTKLPSPFDGIGTNFNYTWSDSSVTIFARPSELPFFKQSEHIGNAAVTYSKDGIDAQLVFSFESPSLVSVGVDADSDNFVDWYNRLDAKASFPLGVRYLRGVIEVRNLNDAALVNYAGVSDRRLQDEIYGRDAYFGIDWRF
jgi:TonB-dependent receptor